jgi:hypothetical protein
MEGGRKEWRERGTDVGRDGGRNGGKRSTFFIVVYFTSVY